jgi:hypothetical protein
VHSELYNLQHIPKPEAKTLSFLRSLTVPHLKTPSNSSLSHYSLSASPKSIPTKAMITLQEHIRLSVSKVSGL